MTTYANPRIDAILPNAPGAGQVAFNRQIFDFADTTYRPSAVGLADLIHIATVPAGHVLIEHLSRFSIPAMEDGTPASDYTIGTAADPDALKATAASETPVVLFGEDLLAVNGPIGAKDADTKIYIKVITAAFDSVVETGQIVSELVYRAWRDELDA